MAEILPFRALRYDYDALGTALSDRIAPPYDILTREDKDRLLANDPCNIVGIDLPYVPAAKLGAPEGYAKSAQALRTWIDEEIMVLEPRPAVYVYHQTYRYADTLYTRRMFIAVIRLEPFDAGVVLAHEKTFGGPKEDRLALMKATKAQLSPIFGLYRDSEDRVGKLFESFVEEPPRAAAKLGDVEEHVWVVDDAETTAALTELMHDQKVYIADGHHRYTTGLNYRDELTISEGPLDEEHPANYIMMVFASMDDPGCLILPTHRVFVDVPDLTLDALKDAWKDGCVDASADDADMTIVHGATGEEAHVRFSNRDMLAKLEPGMSDAWRSLDVAYLHRYLIDELYVKSLGKGEPPTTQYVKAEPDARAQAKSESGIALICKAATMDQLREVSEASEVMPQKSTYFYPKVVTGLTLHRLTRG